jgi:hypothetical protein
MLAWNALDLQHSHVSGQSRKKPVHLWKYITTPLKTSPAKQTEHAMKLPYTPTQLRHAKGGAVTKVWGIGHISPQPLLRARVGDTLYVLCDIVWDDGKGISRSIQVEMDYIGTKKAADPELVLLSGLVESYRTLNGNTIHHYLTGSEIWMAS